MARATSRGRIPFDCGTVLVFGLVLCQPALISAQPSPSASRLIEKFEKTPVFWQQREVAEQLVAIHDPSVVAKLAPWLSNEDRHLRANAAYVLARYGDKRGFDVICAILTDRSDRPEGQGASGPISVITRANDPDAYQKYLHAHHLEWQIPADRYYATTMLGDLHDPRATAVLISLLSDKEVNYVVPYALAKVGDRRAVAPLIKSLSDEDPTVRVMAIRALEHLRAKEAIPALTLLLSDQDYSHVDDLIPVAEAARQAIARLGGHQP
jgi:HEAT repeat protein